MKKEDNIIKIKETIPLKKEKEIKLNDNSKLEDFIKLYLPLIENKIIESDSYNRIIESKFYSIEEKNIKNIRKKIEDFLTIIFNLNVNIKYFEVNLEYSKILLKVSILNTQKILLCEFSILKNIFNFEEILLEDFKITNFKIIENEKNKFFYINGKDKITNFNIEFNPTSEIDFYKIFSIINNK